MFGTAVPLVSVNSINVARISSSEGYRTELVDAFGVFSTDGGKQP